MILFFFLTGPFVRAHLATSLTLSRAIEEEGISTIGPYYEELKAELEDDTVITQALVYQPKTARKLIHQRLEQDLYEAYQHLISHASYPEYKIQGIQEYLYRSQLHPEMHGEFETHFMNTLTHDPEAILNLPKWQVRAPFSETEIEAKLLQLSPMEKVNFTSRVLNSAGAAQYAFHSTIRGMLNPIFKDPVAHVDALAGLLSKMNPKWPPWAQSGAIESLVYARDHAPVDLHKIEKFFNTVLYVLEGRPQSAGYRLAALAVKNGYSKAELDILQKYLFYQVSPSSEDDLLFSVFHNKKISFAPNAREGSMEQALLQLLQPVAKTEDYGNIKKLGAWAFAKMTDENPELAGAWAPYMASEELFPKLFGSSGYHGTSAPIHLVKNSEYHRAIQRSLKFIAENHDLSRAELEKAVLESQPVTRSAYRYEDQLEELLALLPDGAAKGKIASLYRKPGYESSVKAYLHANLDSEIGFRKEYRIEPEFRKYLADHASELEPSVAKAVNQGLFKALVHPDERMQAHTIRANEIDVKEALSTWEKTLAPRLNLTKKDELAGFKEQVIKGLDGYHAEPGNEEERAFLKKLKARVQSRFTLREHRANVKGGFVEVEGTEMPGDQQECTLSSFGKNLFSHN